MSIGERIRYFRNLRGMTQKSLGISAGLPEKSADVRIAQYENGTRTPKEDMLNAIANILWVAPQAITVPDIDTLIGLAHTLFALEDLYKLKVARDDDGFVCLKVAIPEMHPDSSVNYHAVDLQQILNAWLAESEKLQRSEITKEEYDHWRYTFPDQDTSGHWIKVPKIFDEEPKSDVKISHVVKYYSKKLLRHSAEALKPKR